MWPALNHQTIMNLVGLCFMLFFAIALYFLIKDLIKQHREYHLHQKSTEDEPRFGAQTTAKIERE